MDESLICLAVAVLLALVTALPLAIIALVLAIRASRRIEDLSRKMQAPGAVQPAAPPAEALPRAAPAPPVVPAPPAPAVAPPSVPPAPPRAEAGPRPAPAPRRIRWEELIGLKILGWAGVIVVLLGAALFIKYGYEQGWFGRHPWVRVAIPAIFGLALLVAGEVFSRRAYRVLGRVSTGGGLAALYWAAYTAWARFQEPLIPQPVAWGFMAIITAVAILLSVRYASLTVAILSLVGGLAAPILIRPERDPGHVLFLYLIGVNAGVLILAYFKKWRVLNLLALVGTTANVVVWLYAHYWYRGMIATEKLAFIVTYMTVLWAVYFALSMVYHLLGRRDPSRLDLPVTLINVVAYFAGLYVLLRDPAHHWLLGPAAAVLGAAYLGEGLAVRRWAPAQFRFILLQVAQAIGLLTLAIPIQLSGVFIPMAWAVEACVLFWLGVRLKDWRLRAVGLLVHAASIVALLYYFEEAWDTKGMMVLNARTATFAAVALAMAVSSLLYRRLAQRNEAERTVVALVAGAAHALLMALIGVEAYRWHEDARIALQGQHRADMGEVLRNLTWTRDALLAAGLAVYGLVAVGLAAVLRRVLHHGMALVAFVAGFVVLVLAREHLPELKFVAGWNAVGAAFAAVAACLALAAVVSRYGARGMASGRPLAITYELLALGVLLGLYLTELTRAEDYVAHHARSLDMARPLADVHYVYDRTLSLPEQSVLALWAAGFAVMAGLALLRGLWIRSLAHRVAGLAAMAVGLGLLAAVTLGGYEEYKTLLWQPRGVAFLLLAAAMALAAVGYARRMPKESPERRIVATVLAILVHAVVLVCFTLEAEDFWAAHAKAWFPKEELHAWYARHATLSVGYALYAFALLAAGIRRRSAMLRILALVLLGGTLAKVMLLDLSRLEAMWRILSFLGLGLLLLAASFLYYKYRHIIFRPEPAEKAAKEGSDEKP